MVFPRRARHWLVIGLSLISLAVAVLTQTATASQLRPAPQLPIATAESAVANSLDPGRQLYQAGQFAAAIAAWQQAEQHYHRAGDRLNQALCLSYLSLAQQDLTQWEAAQHSLTQSLSLLKTAPTVPAALWAQVLNAQARLLLHTGQAETALTTWQQAQNYYEQAGDRPGSIGSQINQALALQTLGYYRRARQQLEALNAALAVLPNSPIKISGLRALGAALQTLGDLRNSQVVLLKSLDLARQINAQTDLHSILLRLGQLAAVSQPQAAQDYYQQAEQATTNPLEQLQTRLARLNLLLQPPLTESARSRAIALAGPIRQQLVEMAASHAVLYAAVNFVAQLNRLDHPDQILPLADLAQLMDRTVQSAQHLQDASAAAYALSQWGQLYTRTGQWSTARSVIEKSLTIARQLHADDLVAQSAWQLGRLDRHQGDQAAAIAHYTEAVGALQALRGDLVAVPSDVQFSFRESVEPVYRELVDLLLIPAPSQAALVQARNLIENLQGIELDNFFREACLDKPQRIDQVDPTATVIYPIMLPNRIAVIFSTAGQPLHAYITAKPQTDVEQTLNDFLASLNPVSDSQERQRLAAQVYDWLIRPAEQDQILRGTKTLVFVLDGRLRHIPMAALHDGQRYLIEKYAITLSPGLQLMATQPFNARHIQAIVGGISQSHGGFAALPEVETEIKAIAQTVNAAQLLNQAFTSAALADQVKYSQANVVHLATHGQFSSRQEDTFLLTWDGRVNIRELSELLQSRRTQSLPAIELLVLSACETAAGDDRAVLGLAGLAVKSGARSTLATLWPIKDRAAAQLMADFYQHLHQAGTTKAEALRQAQINLMQQTDFKEPFFWSAFVLVGNWQ